MKQHTWRAMEERDLPDILRISNIVHGIYQESLAVYQERLTLYSQGCQTLWHGTEIVGLLISHPWHDGAPPKLNALLGSIPSPAQTYYLHDIAILPEMRGTGAGLHATNFAIERARQEHLSHITLVAVNGADSYWKSRGFEPLPELQYYAYDDETFVMRKTL